MIGPYFIYGISLIGSTVAVTAIAKISIFDACKELPLTTHPHTQYIEVALQFIQHPMLNLAYFKRKSLTVNDENAMQENYPPCTQTLTYRRKPECQTITDGQNDNNSDWAQYAAKLDTLPHNPNRFELNPQFWSNHQVIRQRELFSPLSLRRRIDCESVHT